MNLPWHQVLKQFWQRIQKVLRLRPGSTRAKARDYIWDQRPTDGINAHPMGSTFHPNVVAGFGPRSPDRPLT